jgi:hypothetical protein
MILALPRTTHQEHQDVASMALTCFTSMRLEDVDLAQEGMCTLKAAEKDLPRRMVFILKQTKNDKDGTGHVLGRTFVLACFCDMDMDKTERVQFEKTCKKAPLTVCLDSFPYQIVVDF